MMYVLVNKSKKLGLGLTTPKVTPAYSSIVYKFFGGLSANTNIYININRH